MTQLDYQQLAGPYLMVVGLVVAARVYQLSPALVVSLSSLIAFVPWSDPVDSSNVCYWRSLIATCTLPDYHEARKKEEAVVMAQTSPETSVVMPI